MHFKINDQLWIRGFNQKLLNLNIFVDSLCIKIQAQSCVCKYYVTPHYSLKSLRPVQDFDWQSAGLYTVRCCLNSFKLDSFTFQGNNIVQFHPWKQRFFVTLCPASQLLPVYPIVLTNRKEKWMLHIKMNKVLLFTVPYCKSKNTFNCKYQLYIHVNHFVIKALLNKKKIVQCRFSLWCFFQTYTLQEIFYIFSKMYTLFIFECLCLTFVKI